MVQREAGGRRKATQSLKQTGFGQTALLRAKMAFQSRFRETERHAFGGNAGHGADGSAGEPSEVRHGVATTPSIECRVDMPEG